MVLGRETSNKRIRLKKFDDMFTTAKGDQRAFVSLTDLKTLWFNTGTLCNLECSNCYIESSPKNDRLVYLSVEDVKPYLDEIKSDFHQTEMIGLTGGEPFLNPNIIDILSLILSYDLEVLVLTNANRVLKRHEKKLLELKDKYGNKLHLRVSLDHHTQAVHDQERGHGAFAKTIEALQWLYKNDFDLSLASRSLGSETSEDSLRGHRKLLGDIGVHIDLETKLVIFPEMKSGRELPEITTECWGILNKRPDDQMCATERMIVKRKGEEKAVVMPCTLLAYDDQFIMGSNLKEAKKDVYLNHPFCAEFCVLGGASCSSTK